MRPDITALSVGLIACSLATLGLWSAYGTVNWPLVGVLAPLTFVTIGLFGLILSRSKSSSSPRKEQP